MMFSFPRPTASLPVLRDFALDCALLLLPVSATVASTTNYREH